MRHFKDRLLQRITSQTSLTVSYENRESAKRYSEVGTIKIGDSFKAQISSTVERIENTDFNTRKDYAVKVGQFPLNSATVKFNTNNDRINAQGKNLVASIVTSDGESNGNEIYCIIRGGEITTFCFVKSYSGFSSLADKLRVDAVIKNLSKYKKNR